MSNKTRRSLTTGPIIPIILKMAGGMIFGMLAMSAFNAVDTFFVGKIGPTALAAMSFTFPVVMVFTSIALGLGVGLSSTVSRAIGAGDQHTVKRLATDGLMLAILITAIFSIAGIATIRPLFTLLGARGETLELIHRYMFIWYMGIPFVVIPMSINNVIRATGDTLIPSLIMIISVVINTVLDPLMIFGIGPFPEWGIAGAALATVIARFSTLILSLSILIFREKLIALERIPLKELLNNWKKIAFVGMPAALVQSITPLSLGIITRMLAQYGNNVVAGFGAAGRIELLLLVIPITLSSVMSPFAGQNWGAGKPERIKEAFRFSAIITLIWGALLFIFFLFSATRIIGLFSERTEVIQAGSTYVRIMAISYGFFGIMMIASQILNALNKPIHAALLIISRSFILNIPLALLGSFLFNETGIFAANSLANIAGGCAGFILLPLIINRHHRRKAIRKEKEVLELKPLKVME